MQSTVSSLGRELYVYSVEVVTLEAEISRGHVRVTTCQIDR